MWGRVEVTAAGGAGVEKPSGAKLEMPVVLGRFSGLERPKKRERGKKKKKVLNCSKMMQKSVLVNMCLTDVSR